MEQDNLSAMPQEPNDRSKLIRKLRWIGMEEEAKHLQLALRSLPPEVSKIRPPAKIRPPRGRPIRSGEWQLTQLAIVTRYSPYRIGFTVSGSGTRPAGRGQFFT